jgi:polyhydroxyalkanoate synthesis regulator protein
MPFNQIEEMSKQNIAIFETAMKMFNPFHTDGNECEKKNTDSASSVRNEQLNDLRKRINKMQQQLDELASQRPE